MILINGLNRKHLAAPEKCCAVDFNLFSKKRNPEFQIFEIRDDSDLKRIEKF